MVATKRVGARIPSWRRAQAILAQAVRAGQSQDKIEALRADFIAGRLADLIVRTTAGAPPLRPEHLAELHGVLDATQSGPQ